MLVPEDIVSFESGDLACMVGFEHDEVSVDANAPIPMTIRVTHIYRRINGEWYLVHRHAYFPPADQRARDQDSRGIRARLTYRWTANSGTNADIVEGPTLEEARGQFPALA